MYLIVVTEKACATASAARSASRLPRTRWTTSNRSVSTRTAPSSGWCGSSSAGAHTSSAPSKTRVCTLHTYVLSILIHYSADRLLCHGMNCSVGFENVMNSYFSTMWLVLFVTLILPEHHAPRPHQKKARWRFTATSACTSSPTCSRPSRARTAGGASSADSLTTSSTSSFPTSDSPSPSSPRRSRALPSPGASPRPGMTKKLSNII